ncbi:Gti1/Pac2 family protein [Apiospora phragmitis]|uniref:Gti1/Pac2 family protein n=1 Tax=Apiospora phragmitis TaxID=2905665 RepID=A0ABR1SR26_9PEZI
MKDQRKYECKYCSRLFRRSEHKMRHERTHTKEKPFVCDCKDSFARLDLLKRHKRLVHKDDSNKSPDMAASAVESLDVKSWKDPSQQPVGGNSTDPRLDGVPDSINQRNQVEALALSFGSGDQRTWINDIDLPEKMDLDISGHIPSSKPSQTSLVRWKVDPFPCSFDGSDSCYPVPPSPGTVHGNPSSRLSVPLCESYPLPASGITHVSACAQSPLASHATVPNDQQPAQVARSLGRFACEPLAPVAPTTDLTLDDRRGIVSEPHQKALLLHDCGNGEGEENPSRHQPEQAVRIGRISSPKKTAVDVGPPIRPTFVGFIGSVMDALVLFESCLNGTKTAVRRNPRKDELSSLIRSGNIFVYQDISSDIHRWCDELSWHRVLQPSKRNTFSIYRELVKQAMIQAPKIKKGGLVKKVLAVKHNGIKHFLVSYCIEDMENKLPRPSECLQITLRDGLISDGGGQETVLKRISTPSYQKGKKRKRRTSTEKRDICRFVTKNPKYSQMDVSNNFKIPINSLHNILREKHRWLSHEEEVR